MALSKNEKNKRAQEIGTRAGLDEVYVNNRDEFFTSYCNALNSVKGDKKKVATIKVKAAAESVEPNTDETETGGDEK